MHRFDERFWLNEAYKVMAENEHRAALNRELRAARHLRPSRRQRLAHLFIRLARWLAPESFDADARIEDNGALPRAASPEPCV